jgi:hypothetical protein
MMLRTIAGRAAVALGLFLSLSLPAAPACNGAGCANGKPLDIMQFMREQAASTRVGEARHARGKPRYAKPQAKTAAKHRNDRTIAARDASWPMPAPMPAEAAASFASRPVQASQQADVAGTGEPNAVDHAAKSAPAETMGAAVTSGPAVQLVDAAEFNDIDRKADDGAPISVQAAPRDDTQIKAEQAESSWLQWLWSALTNTVIALATAVRQLTRI